MENEELNKILEQYKTDLTTHNLDEESQLEEVLKSSCSLSTKSIFALKVLIKKIPNGELRPQQLELIHRMSNVIETEDDGLLQAGTGVGKSISYLIPAIISGKKCFVTTSTKQLTSQLTDKDLPLLKEYLFPDLQYSGLQSLSNYICIKKYLDMFEEIQENPGLYEKTRPDDLKSVMIIKPYYEKYLLGNIKPVDFTLESTGCECESAQCSGAGCIRGCKFKNKSICPVYRLCQQIMASDVVVTNHAYVSKMLVGASKDKAKELGLLKGRPLWICDEAHDLEGYLENAFSTKLEAGVLKYVYIPKLKKYLETMVMQETFNNTFKEYDTKLKESNIPVDDECRYHSYEQLANDVRSIGLVIGRILKVMDRYRFDAENEIESKTSVEREFEFDDSDNEEISKCIDILLKIQIRLETLTSVNVKYVPTIRNIVSDLANALEIFYKSSGNKESYVTYYDYMAPRHDNDDPFSISSTFLQSGEALQAALGCLDLEKSELVTVNKNKINMIGVSATLCVGGSFRDTAEKLGMTKLKDMHCQCTDVGTVFDYQKQGLMYIPQGIPDVKKNRTEHFDYFKKSIKELIKISHGGALILCTTIKETTETYHYLLEEFGGTYTVLSAEDKRWKTKNDLVKAFRDDENSILIGTRGFFQGLDVQGDSLRLLCLNKLPFGNPGVVSKRKGEIAKSKGLDDFRITAIVPTTMMLLQAVGRLIRHTSDKGVIALYDNRLYTGSYWISPLTMSLPPFRTTTDLKDVEEFFTENKSEE